MSAMRTLEGLGWEWRENGVVVCVQLDGGVKQCVFVPLNRVWHEFAKAHASVGLPFELAVGEAPSVEGLFSSIAKAVSSAAKGVAKSVTAPAKAVATAAKAVAKTAANYAQHAVTALSKIPVVGPLASATASLMTQPLQVADALAKGGRIDRVALGSLKSSLNSAKTIAPYVQTVVSFVPGVGQGLSGAIGGAVALASGQSISQAMLAAVKGAIPGGPMAQAAFEVASGVMQGKPIDQIALNALPIPPQSKQLLQQGLGLAKDLAAGKRVDQALLDRATKSLPADVQKAIQIGTAIGHAKSIQDAAVHLASIAAPPAAKAAANAANLTNLFKAGTIAAQAIQAGKQAPGLVAAVQKGLVAKQAYAQIVQQASAGHPEARQIVGAMMTRMPAAPPAVLLGGARPRVGAPFIPRYSQGTPAAVGAPGWTFHNPSPFAHGARPHAPRAHAHQHRQFHAAYAH